MILETYVAASARVRLLSRAGAAGFLLLMAMPAWSSSDLEINGAWAAATPPGARTAAVYLTLENRGEPDVIVAASSDASSTVELHTHAHVDGMMRMEKLETVAVPGSSEVRFRPHGRHLMLIDLAAPLRAGETIRVTLRFRHAGDVEFAAEVRDIRQ